MKKTIIWKAFYQNIKKDNSQNNYNLIKILEKNYQLISNKLN